MEDYDYWNETADEMDNTKMFILLFVSPEIRGLIIYADLRRTLYEGWSDNNVKQISFKREVKLFY